MSRRERKGTDENGGSGGGKNVKDQTTLLFPCHLIPVLFGKPLAESPFALAGI
jgi:hypothetical protein